MTKRLVFILSFLLALLVSVGAAFWVIVYQKQSPYPTELSGAFSLEISYADDLLTAQNGQLKGDLVKAGVEKTATPTTLVVKHTTPDGTVYSYPIHRAHTNVYKLENTELVYGVAEYNEDGSLKFTNNNSKLTAQTSGTTAVAVKVILKDKDAANSATQKFLRALLDLPAPTDEGAKNAPATFNANGMIFNVTNNLVKEVYQNNATVAMNAIAYNGSNYYGTIEGALAASTSGTVYVYPQTTVKLGTAQKTNSDGTTTTYGIISSVTENELVPQNPYIVKNCTIASGVTLCLPWEGTKAVPAAETVQSHESLVANADNPVANLTKGTLNATLCTNHVTMQTNVQLTNLGTLIVGGVVCGGNGGSAAGYSANQYARITLKANAKIINGKSDGSDAADIQCYGYIYEDTTKNGSQIILYGKSSYISPFKVMEHRGGTVFSDMAGGDINNPQLECSPFNRFYMPNSSVEMTFHYNSSLYGYADLYTNKKLIIPAQHNITTIKMVGTSDEHLLKFANSSTYVVTKYNPATEIHDIDVYGSSVLNSLALNVSIPLMGTLNLSTANVYFPLSWHFNIRLWKGNEKTATFTSMSQKVKLLTGSSVTIGAGVNATLPSIVVYDTFTDTYSTTTSLRYENGKSSAKLIVNGSLTVDSFGGPIETQASKTALTVNTATSITSKEVIDGKEYQKITKTLALPKYADATKNYTDKGTYYSEKRSDNTYGWYSTIFKISYDANGGSAVEDTNVELKQGGGYTFTETILSGKTTTREHYTFTHWCTQDNCTNGSTCANKASGKTVYGDTTLYAAWIKNQYKLNYVYVVPDGDGVKEMDSGISPTEFTIDTTTITLNNTPTAPTYTTEGGETKSYNFSGWFTAVQNGEPITAIIVEDYRDLAFANGGTYGEATIYAVWTKDITYTVKFNNGCDASKGGYDIIRSTTVTLDEEGNGTLTAPITADDGTTSLYAHNDNPNDKMYFLGWYVDENFETAYTNFAQLQALVPADGENYERTLYAKWVEKQNTISFVTTYPSGTTGSPTAPTLDNVYLYTSQTLNLATNINDKMTTYDANSAVNKYFNGWTAVGATISETTVTPTATSATLTVNWATKATLSFSTAYPTDKTGSPTAPTLSTIYVKPNAAFTIPTSITNTMTSDADETNTAVNYYFNGWTTTGSTNVSKVEGTNNNVITVSSGATSATLATNWTKKWQLTLTLNSKTATLYRYGTKVEILSTTYSSTSGHNGTNLWINPNTQATLSFKAQWTRTGRLTESTTTNNCTSSQVSTSAGTITGGTNGQFTLTMNGNATLTIKHG